jgi:hypothetical protein
VETGCLKPVVFHSKKIAKAEINYEIDDTEMLAIISAFKEWPRYLQTTSLTITVYSDDKTLNTILPPQF